MSGGSYKYSVSEQWKIAYGLTAFFSILSGTVIPTVYLVSKKSRHHPAIILVLICLFEMISCFHLMIWAMDLPNFLHFFDVNQLWSLWTTWSSKGITRGDDKQNFLYDFCIMNQTCYFLSVIFEFAYYIIMCIDLIITLKRPFISGSARMPWYHFGAIVYSLSVFSLIWKNIQVKCHHLTSETISTDGPQLDIAYDPLILTEILFYLVGLVSIAMAWQAKQSNTNNELFEAKNQYLLNHGIMIVMTFCVWILPFMNSIQTAKNSFNIFLMNISFLLLLAQGIFIATVRLSERFFRERVKFFIRTIFGKVSIQEKVSMDFQDLNDEADMDGWNYSLAMLVGKAQNREVVSHILSGVLNITRYETSTGTKNQETLPTGKTLLKWAQEIKKQKFKNEKHGFSIGSLDQVESPNQINRPLLSSSIGEIHFRETAMIEYAPRLFQVLRNRNGITQESFYHSLCIDKNEAQIKRAQQSLGKSGSFFFFSHDNRLILKTMNHTELKVLTKKLLQPYVTHIRENKNSIIAQVYGVYTVQIEGVAPVHLILMENTLGTLAQHGGADRTYDLKGSLINRFVKIGPSKQSVQLTNDTASEKGESFALSNIVKPNLQVSKVLKDQNFLMSDDLFINLDSNSREQLYEQLKRDTDFLLQNHIMDYSLLLGISCPNTTHEEIGYNPHRQVVDTSGNVMSFAIIDFLQLFDIYKRMEYHYKTAFKDKTSRGMISCVLPDSYQARFLSFMNQIICSIIKQ